MMNKIDTTALFLLPTDYRNHPLNNYIQLQCNYDFRSWVKSFNSIFSDLIVYDQTVGFVEKGVCLMLDEINGIIAKTKPQLLIFTGQMFEVDESLLLMAQKNNITTIGYFFDDIARFEEHSKFFIPYLDYIITFDSSKSLNKYSDIGASANLVDFFPCSEVFSKKSGHQISYDVSFVGSKIADRAEIIMKIKSVGIDITVFGNGWENDFISTDEMVNIFNRSKINLNFGKTYDNSGSMQLKARIFEICLSGGFLLTEYIPGLENYYEIGKEIDCFYSVDEAIKKIHYYLQNEKERMKIAKAGYEKTFSNYTFEKGMMNFFSNIKSFPIKRNTLKSINISRNATLLRFRWHFLAAYGWLMLSDKKKSKEQIAIAKRYKKNDFKLKIIEFFVYLPKYLTKFFLPFTIQCYSMIVRVIKKLLKLNREVF